jgi:TonB family protein
VSLRRFKNWIACGALAAVILAGMVPSAMADDRKIKTQVTPVYPELAKKMNVSGAVKVEIVITPTGTVKSAKALGGHPLLIEPSVEAAKRCKFEAGSGESTQVIVFNFKGTQ